ncbi:MAG: hypothetical protein CML68_12350 [Rhodobacteraceae bacterium]|nr:hypothetical protein [Paracoccaceae bacterium]
MMCGLAVLVAGVLLLMGSTGAFADPDQPMRTPADEALAWDEDVAAGAGVGGGAGPTGRIGWRGSGWLLTNDALGDRKDRWRSGGFSLSGAFTGMADPARVDSVEIEGPGDGRPPGASGPMAWDAGLTGPIAAGPDSSGPVTAVPDDFWEIRFQAQVIQPDNLSRADPSDRPYAGVLALGLHRHVGVGPHEFALGGDLVLAGPQTGVDDLQAAVHDVVGGPDPADEILSAQIGNSLRPTAVFEYGHTLGLSPAVTLRPFVEARFGDETLARLGADLSLGLTGEPGIWIRDSVTGQRYRVGAAEGSGMSLVIGADTARVADSLYLPGAGDGPELSERRDRLRAGVRYDQDGLSVFYGMTWLGREFSGQPEPQVLGSLQVRLRF